MEIPPSLLAGYGLWATARRPHTARSPVSAHERLAVAGRSPHGRRRAASSLPSPVLPAALPRNRGPPLAGPSRRSLPQLGETHRPPLIITLTPCWSTAARRLVPPAGRCRSPQLGETHWQSLSSPYRGLRPFLTLLCFRLPYDSRDPGVLPPCRAPC